MKPNIGIPEKKLKNSATVLDVILPNEMTLYVKTRKSLWKQLEESIDEVAERIRKPGHKTPGTMEEFSKLTSIKESPEKYPSSKEMIKELLRDHENGYLFF